MAEKLLEVRNLKKYFSTKAGLLHAIDGVSFSIDKGKTLGIGRIGLRKVDDWEMRPPSAGADVRRGGVQRAKYSELGRRD